ncbi:FtsQ-type POTRA domain-containing protein, partial [Candidatus Pelagibacter sp.]|nr:FtsQ-type POTRA domain-containing protein [Candidatus Pelagibacter sp.]
MLQQKGRKSIIYLFLLILAGSINNTSFNNTNFDKIQTIKVTGLSSTENFIIINKIKKLKLKNIFFINSDQIKKIIDSNTLVEKYKVYKNYPSGLEINITKTKFLAKINSQGNIFIIGSNGKLSKDYDNKNKLPFIFGKPNIQEFLQFKKVIDHSKFRYEHIKNF